MHALERIRAWLRPGGLLLDLHPEPVRPTVVLGYDGLRAVHLGEVDNSRLVGNVHAARAALALVVERGWFARERSQLYDFISHFGSVDSWLRYREERRSTSVVEPALIARAREMMLARPSAELRVREQVLATRLRRIVASPASFDSERAE